MKGLKRKLSAYLIVILCLVNIPFAGVISAAAEEPDETPEDFFYATASEGDIPKYYTELSTSSCCFTDRNGNTQYRIFGSLTKLASPSWYEASEEYEPAIDAKKINCEEEYVTLAPIEYSIIPEGEYTEDLWQEFLGKKENGIYATNSDSKKAFREEYTSTYSDGFSTDVLEYDSHYETFGAFGLKGHGNAIIEYVAYGRILNQDTTPTEPGWIPFKNEDALTYTVKYISSKDDLVLYGYSDGIRGATTEGKVSPVDIDGYQTPDEHQLEGDKEEVVFTYDPVSYHIINYVYGDGSEADDHSTDFKYDESEKTISEGSVHEGYELQAYKFSFDVD